MSEPKTKRNKASVSAFLNSIEDARRRKDAKTINRMMKEATGEKPEMWGESIVGFGTSTVTYADGRTGDWMLTGYSPRKQSLSLYIMGGLSRSSLSKSSLAKNASLLKKLGKHKASKGCLYLNRLEDVDLEVLRKLIEASVAAKRA